MIYGEWNDMPDDIPNDMPIENQMICQMISHQEIIYQMWLWTIWIRNNLCDKYDQNSEENTLKVVAPQVTEEKDFTVPITKT